jgi:hypothetical protein
LSQIQICQFLVFLPLWIFFSFSLLNFFSYSEEKINNGTCLYCII